MIPDGFWCNSSVEWDARLFERVVRMSTYIAGSENLDINWIERARSLPPVVRNFVAGCLQPEIASEPIDKYGPRDGKLLYRFRASQVCDVDRAVVDSRRAFEGGRAPRDLYRMRLFGAAVVLRPPRTSHWIWKLSDRG